MKNSEFTTTDSSTMDGTSMDYLQIAQGSSKRRILVVEDVLSSRKMLIRLLERSGHSCLSASHGGEAVQMVADDMAAAKENPDHVPISDILMDYEVNFVS